MSNYALTDMCASCGRTYGEHFGAYCDEDDTMRKFVPMEADDDLGSVVLPVSLRDWFAGQALSVFEIDQTDLRLLQAGGKPAHDVVAEFCYNLADAMLKARGGGK